MIFFLFINYGKMKCKKIDVLFYHRSINIGIYNVLSIWILIFYLGYCALIVYFFIKATIFTHLGFILSFLIIVCEFERLNIVIIF